MKFALITTLLFLFSCSLCEKIVPQIISVSTSPSIALPAKDKCTTDPINPTVVVLQEKLKWTRTRMDSFNVCIDISNLEQTVDLCDPAKNATVTTEVIFKNGSQSIKDNTLASFQINQAMATEKGRIFICHQYTPCDVYKQLSELHINLAETSLEVNMKIANLFSSHKTGTAAAMVRGAGIEVVKNDIPAEYTAELPFLAGFTVHYSPELFDKADIEFSETAGLYTHTLVTASTMKEGGFVPSCTEQNLPEKIHMVNFIPSTDRKCPPGDTTCNTEVKISIKEKKESNSATSSFVSSLIVFSALTLLFI